MRLPSKDLQAINEAYKGSVLNELMTLPKSHDAPGVLMYSPTPGRIDQFKVGDHFDQMNMEDGTIVFIDSGDDKIYLYDENTQEGWYITVDELNAKAKGNGKWYIVPPYKMNAHKYDASGARKEEFRGQDGYNESYRGSVLKENKSPVLYFSPTPGNIKRYKVGDEFFIRGLSGIEGGTIVGIDAAKDEVHMTDDGEGWTVSVKELNDAAGMPRAFYIKAQLPNPPAEIHI